MINELITLLDMTKIIKDLVEDESLFKRERDQFILDLQSKLDERQPLIDKFEQLKLNQQSGSIPLTENEIAIRDEIVKIDQELKAIMILRLKDHHAEWRMVHQKGKSVSKYTRPYQLPTSNGAFYDKRK